MTLHITMDKNEFSMPKQFSVDGVVYPGLMMSTESFQNVTRLAPQPGDVLMASFPRSGSHWLLHATSLIMTRGNVDVVNSVPMSSRIPMIEVHLRRKGKSIRKLSGYSGRIMSTHLQYEYIQQLVKDQQMKIIVTIRNPKDMLVSYYHFYQINKYLGNFTGTWDKYFELFRMKNLAFGDWLDHVSGYWKNCSGMPNVLFVHFEEAKADIVGTLRRISDFLDHKLDDKVLNKIAEEVSLQSMKKNPSVNYQQLVGQGIFNKADSFIRKGEMGGWRSYFTEEQRIYVDKHYVEPAQSTGILPKDALDSRDVPSRRNGSKL